LEQGLQEGNQAAAAGYDKLVETFIRIGYSWKLIGFIFYINVSFLLAGAGESGKTTIIKQMKILHISGFSERYITFLINPI
jgi:hypothetical protein